MDIDPASPALASLAAELRAQAGADAFYVFWTGSPGTAAPRPPARAARTLLAFPTPDAALSFAQRRVLRGPGELPRLRRLTIAQLLLAVARSAAIATLTLVTDPYDAASSAAPGGLPDGVHITRDAVVRRLAEPPATGA